MKALSRINQLSGRVLTLAAPWPWSREETPNSAEAVAKMVRERWGSRYPWELPTEITRVYDSSAARDALDWEPVWTFERVVQELETGRIESDAFRGLF